MCARSVASTSLSRRCVDGQPCQLIRESLALTPEPHISSSLADHGDVRIYTMLLALHGCIPPGIFTYPWCCILRLTLEGIGVGGLDTDVGGGVAASVGAGGAAAGTKNSAATGPAFGMGT